MKRQEEVMVCSRNVCCCLIKRSFVQTPDGSLLDEVVLLELLSHILISRISAENTFREFVKKSIKKQA